MKHFIIYFLLIILFACSPSQKKMKIVSQKKIQLNEISFDTVIFDNFHNSYSGDFSVCNDSIYFADHLFGTVSVFNQYGNHQSIHGGVGKGPNEVISLRQMESGAFNYFILGDMWDFYVFNQKWQKINQFRIDWDDKTPVKELMKYADPNAKGIYEIKYENPQLKFLSDHELLVNITTEHPKLNAFMTDEFYQSAKIVALLNTKSGKVEKIFGCKSEEYLKHKYLANFDNNYLEYKNDDLFVSYEIDSLIYIYDDVNLVKAFGCEGKFMNQNYKVHNANIEETEKHYHAERKKYGWYGEIKYFPEDKIFTRVYYTGEPKCQERLQIYKDEILIGDVAIQNSIKSKVLGKIKDSYYLYTGEPDKNGEYFLLKFRLL